MDPTSILSLITGLAGTGVKIAGAVDMASKAGNRQSVVAKEQQLQAARNAGLMSAVRGPNPTLSRRQLLLANQTSAAQMAGAAAAESNAQQDREMLANKAVFDAIGSGLGTVAGGLSEAGALGATTGQPAGAQASLQAPGQDDTMKRVLGLGAQPTGSATAALVSRAPTTQQTGMDRGAGLSAPRPGPGAVLQPQLPPQASFGPGATAAAAPAAPPGGAPGTFQMRDPGANPSGDFAPQPTAGPALAGMQQPQVAGTPEHPAVAEMRRRLLGMNPGVQGPSAMDTNALRQQGLLPYLLRR